MGEARAKAVQDLVNQGSISPRMAEALVPTPDAPQAPSISHMRVLQSVRFNRTENSSLNANKDKCSFRMGEIGVYVDGETCPTILIPWSNIAWVEMK